MNLNEERGEGGGGVLLVRVSINVWRPIQPST